MANLRQEIAVGDTGAEFVAALTANAKNTNIRVYNVEDYGAVHDGSTDDTAAIQAAIDACDTAGGGTVFFPNGLYIISGALQNDVGEDDIDYNSQITIPYPATYAAKHTISLIGESPAPYSITGAASEGYAMSNCGAILKSTIAGSGDWPSVICSRGKAFIGATQRNVNDLHIRNITVMVNAFEDGDGPSMCGINLLHQQYFYVDHVDVVVDVAPAQTVQPVNHVFGFAGGFIGDDHGKIGKLSVRSFYYGAIVGEGVSADWLFLYDNYIGLMPLKSYYGNNINTAFLHWNCYHIAAQQETFYDWVIGETSLKIAFAGIEDSEDPRLPVWTRYVDEILDTNNFLYGFVDYHTGTANGGSGHYVEKANGGRNLLIRNIIKSSNYHWTTATRPTSPGYGCTGFNTTTNKLEVHNGTTWVDLH